MSSPTGAHGEHTWPMMSPNDAVEYRVPAASAAPGMLGIGMLVGIFFLVVSVTTGDPPLWFVLAFLAIWGWQAFNYLVRFARAASIESGTLHWTGYLKSEQVPLDQIARVSLGFGGTVQVVECRDGRKLRIPIMQGYRSFGEALAEALAGISVELGSYSRFVDRVRFGNKKSDGRT
jgi:xanthosine utilization system XapX-like protein